MSDYHQIRTLLSSLDLIEGTTTRIDCPICMKSNTFSITKKQGTTKWFCFSVGCATRGVIDLDLTKSDLCGILSRVDEELKPYRIPEYIVKGLPSTIEWIKSYGIALDSTIDVRYDVRADRQMFMTWHDGVCYGGVGRGTKPKWLVYGSKLPLVVRRGNSRAIVVEDALSAAKVPATYDGIALLGTHLPDHYIPYIRGYDELLLALDADATDKAIAMQRQLSIYRKTTLVPLKMDIKDMSHRDIESLFKDQSDG